MKFFQKTLSYGIDRQRVMQAFSDGTTIRTKRYFTPLYETVTENGVTKKLHYLTSSTGLFAIFASYNNGGGTMHYTLKDHQGNLTATISGNTVERLSYDAWGRRRNPVGFGYATVAEPVEATFDRGYTLHEHYDEFDLINMNGRLYDPVLGRMLSPDIAIQDLYNQQAYNRYSYCLNNPLRFTDPSGYFVDWYEKNGRIIWDDKVTCPENTPQGGTYIGPDILNYLNVPSAFEIVKETKFGVSLNGVLGETDHNGVLYPNQNIGLVPTVPVDYVSGSLWVDVKTVDYSTDETSGTSHNIKVFSELVFNFGFTQSCNTMDFKGGACVYCKDETYYERLTPMDPSISQIQATGTDFKKASIVIPADRIKSPDYFIEANIRAGSPQSSMFVNPTIVDMKWNLRKRVTLNSF